MERISVRNLAAAIRLIREPVVVTYSYPRNHPLYGAGEETGVYMPMEQYVALTGREPGSGAASVHAGDGAEPHDA